MYPQELAKNTFDWLGIETGSIEITNLDTSKNPNENMELWKQTVQIATENIMTLAKQSIDENPFLKGVVIMKRTPRYDPEEIDPYAIKSKLSNYGNNLYDQIWQRMGCPDKIIIGENNLTCYGALKDKRFGHPEAPLFDGIHLLGELGGAHYTGAVLKVFKIKLNR